MTSKQTITGTGNRKFQCNGPAKEWAAALAKIMKGMGTDREGVALAACVAAGMPVVLAKIAKGSEVADPRPIHSAPPAPKAKAPKAKAPKAKAPKAKAPKAPKAAEVAS